MEAYNFLLERTLLKLQGWKQKQLNQAGKEVMIKSVIQAIPSYAMTCFLLPKKFCDKLNSYVSNFWWGGDPEDKGIHWASWTRATQSKSQGGLGFRDFKAFNLAMLAKQGWRLTINPHSYWGKFIKGLYFPNSDFLRATKGRQASWSWSSLIQGRDILVKGVRWQVSDGSLIQFWEDKWLPSSKDFMIHSARPPDCPIHWVRDIIDERTKSWKEEVVRAIVSQEEADAILSIPVSHSGKQDSLIWHPNTNGSYSVKSGYQVAIAEAMENLPTKASPSFQPPDSMWKFIWNLDVPPKLKHFWWRACCNLLATKENLFRRKCNPSPMCPICHIEPESVEHMLFRCEWTLATWFGSGLTYKVDSLALSSVMRWTIAIMESFNSATEGRDIMSKCVVLGWQIWKARNDWIFNCVQIDPRVVVDKASYSWKEYQRYKANRETKDYLVADMDRTAGWTPPPKGKVKINCDVARAKGSTKAAIAAILRNHRGEILDGRTAAVCITSSLQGEALAIRLALTMILPSYHHLTTVESDNQCIIKLCSTEDAPPWECSAIVKDIRCQSTSINCSFRWVPRTCNKVAHWVASQSLKDSLPPNWVSNPPPLLSSLCNCDASGEVP